MPLRRNQKIGIAAAGGAAAIGLTAALIYAARRPKCGPGMVLSKTTGNCEPVVIVGFPGGSPDADPLTQATRRFCSYPVALTLAQRELLEQSVFAPLVLEANGFDWNGPAEIDAGIASVATEAIKRLCVGLPRPRTREVALTLARSAWWAVTGQSGQ